MSAWGGTPLATCGEELRPLKSQLLRDLQHWPHASIREQVPSGDARELYG